MDEMLSVSFSTLREATNLVGEPLLFSFLVLETLLNETLSNDGRTRGCLSDESILLVMRAIFQSINAF